MKKCIFLLIIILIAFHNIKALAIPTVHPQNNSTIKPVVKGPVLASGKLINGRVKNISILMVYVPGGSFNMGSNDVGDDAKPIHKVTLHSFFIGKYEVTQAQWKAVMGNAPSDFHGCDNCPVESVSWDDVQDFLKKLNKKTGKHYRLPTEAEWEYAARGGAKSKGYNYSGSNDLSVVAWNIANSTGKTHPKGQKQANELGIYDMSGNVWEWCQDWYAADYYAASPSENPQGPPGGSFRAIRGGSWSNSAVHCAVAARESSFQGSRLNDLGFRLVLAN